MAFLLCTPDMHWWLVMRGIAFFYKCHISLRCAVFFLFRLPLVIIRHNIVWIQWIENHIYSAKKFSWTLIMDVRQSQKRYAFVLFPVEVVCSLTLGFVFNSFVSFLLLRTIKHDHNWGRETLCSLIRFMILNISRESERCSHNEELGATLEIWCQTFVL